MTDITGVSARSLVYAPNPEFRQDLDGAMEMQSKRRGFSDTTWANAFLAVGAKKLFDQIKSSVPDDPDYKVDTAWHTASTTLFFPAFDGRHYHISVEGFMESRSDISTAAGVRLDVDGAQTVRYFFDFKDDSKHEFGLMTTYAHTGVESRVNVKLLWSNDVLLVIGSRGTRLHEVKYEVAEI